MAGRIRTIKPEFLEDEKLGIMSPLTRLLFACTWLMADDYGNFRANPAWVRSQAFPYDEETDVGAIREALATLTRECMLTLYQVRGQSYYHVTNWSKHQRIDKPGKPHCPGPEEAENLPKTEHSRDSRETVAKPSRDCSETLAPDRDLDRDLDQRPPNLLPQKARTRELGTTRELGSAAAAAEPEPKKTAPDVPNRLRRAVTAWESLRADELHAHSQRDPAGASFVDFTKWPEIEQIQRAWCAAVGLVPRKLGQFSAANRHLGAILEAIAHFGVEHTLKACEQAAHDPWCCGERGSEADPPRKRNTDCMSIRVISRLLDESGCDEPSRVTPAVARMLDEERKRCAL